MTLVFRNLSYHHLEHRYCARVPVSSTTDLMSPEHDGGSSQSCRERKQAIPGAARNRLTRGKNLTALPCLVILLIELLCQSLSVGAAAKSDIQTSISDSLYELPDIQASSHHHGTDERHIVNITAKTDHGDYATDICRSTQIDADGGMRNVHRFLVLFSGHPRLVPYPIPSIIV